MIETSAETKVSPSLRTDFPEGDLDELEDEQLLDLVRLGSGDAYAVLFARYRVAGFRFARYLSNSVDANDIVSETFAQVLHQLRQGRGPDSSFRSYLFTSIRREAGRRAKMTRRVSPTDDVAVMDRSVSMFDGKVDRFERDIVRAAFESLPERWQTVLWRMEVDGLKPHEIAPTLGMKPNGVSALAWRAREGLRRAYLHHHLASMPADRSDSACDEARQRLAGFIRGTATTRDWSIVDSHLESCAACAGVHLELEEVNVHLGAVSSVIAIAFAAPASGVVGGLIAKAAILAKSAAASVGTTAAIVVTSVTVAQIPAVPPAQATTLDARTRQPVQHEPDRTQGPAADRESSAQTSSSTTTGSSGPEQLVPAGPAPPPGTSSGPVSVEVGNGAGASVDVGESNVGASVNVGNNDVGASVNVGEGQVGASVDVDKADVSVFADAGKTTATATVDLDEPTNSSVTVDKTEVKVADVEKKLTDTAGDLVATE